MTEYGGGGGSRRRSRGSVYVDNPAYGFFVAGSSISGMNGLYVRVDPASLALHQDDVILAYLERESGWIMALCEEEWLLIDNARMNRLTHEGNTLIPGSGKRWKRTWTSTPFCEDRSSELTTKNLEEEEDELPWQVIALLDVGIVRDLLFSKRHRDRRVAAALAGDDLPDLPPRSLPRILKDCYEGGSWLYIVTAEFARLRIDDYETVLKRGDYVRVVERDDLELRLSNGGIVDASLCEEVSERPAEGGVGGTDDVDDFDKEYDKPFEHLLENGQEPTAVDDSLLEEDSFVWEDPPQVDDYVAAQDILEVGDECWVAVGGERVPKSAVVRQIKGGWRPYSVSIDDGQIVCVDARLARRSTTKPPPTFEGDGLEDDAFVLNSCDLARATPASIRAAFRASERDAMFSARIAPSDPRPNSARRARALRRLIEHNQENQLSSDESRGSAAAALLEPLERVKEGCIGTRAADAARRAVDARSMETARKGMDGLRQLASDEECRLSAADVLIREAEDVVDDFGGDLTRLRLSLCRALLSSGRDADALKEAKKAAESACDDAASLAMLAVCLFRSAIRDEAASLCMRAARAGPASGQDAAWASQYAAEMMRGVTRATKAKIVADDKYRRGDFKAAVEAYTIAIDACCPDDLWLLATLRSNRSACARRLRRLDLALEDADAALRIYPSFAKALFRRAVTLLEMDRPLAARRAFIDLLRVDRNWPKLSEWLTRATATAKRHHRVSDIDDLDEISDNDENHTNNHPREDGEAKRIPERQQAATTADLSNPSLRFDHYCVLGVDTDAGEAQLKRAYRLKSIKWHPDKPGGSTTAFQRIAEAYEILSNEEKRKAYDLGEDLKQKGGDDSDSEERNEKSLHEQVERKYFPERYEFHPFGDPFVEKRKMRARRANSSRPAWYDPKYY